MTALCSLGCEEQCGQPMDCQAPGDAPGRYLGDQPPAIVPPVETLEEQ